MVHALNLGIELGLFEALIRCPPPVTIDKFLESVPYSKEFLPTWIHVMQSAAVFKVDREKIITFKDDWQEALTDENSMIYAAGLTKCHLEITKTYQKFSKIYENQERCSLMQHDEGLISAIAADGKRFCNIFLNQIIDKIPPLRFKLDHGCTFYEVGCGGGEFLLDLAGRLQSTNFTGVDISKKAIDIAKARHTKISQLNNIKFVNSCITKLEEFTADCIVMIEVLHEIKPDIRIKALKACRRALKPDGIFIIIDMLVPEDPITYNSGQQILSSLIQFFEAPWGSKLVSKKQFYSLLQVAGFKNLQAIIQTDEIIAVFAIMDQK